ncbi:hypothetical protein A3Q56_01999 [Intoshia linei]|uniref:C2H2-type domain-containing protein n=1 Tax=Intoshia linei TaxID=1819745 RepID=A0A177B7J7_9BILA|nr:hypothetical protein A3Q56_01999 [Intoshia linei]
MNEPNNYAVHVYDHDMVNQENVENYNDLNNIDNFQNDQEDSILDKFSILKSKNKILPDSTFKNYATQNVDTDKDFKFDKIRKLDNHIQFHPCRYRSNKTISPSVSNGQYKSQKVKGNQINSIFNQPKKLTKRMYTKPKKNHIFHCNYPGCNKLYAKGCHLKVVLFLL